jgi:hypothetical protein
MSFSFDVDLDAMCDKCHHSVEQYEDIFCEECFESERAAKERLLAENNRLRGIIRDAGIELFDRDDNPVFLCPVLEELYGPKAEAKRVAV